MKDKPTGIFNSNSYLNKYVILQYILLAIILIGLSFYYYSDTISAFPSHIHAWTQSDRYAVALGFLSDFNFFKPHTYNLLTEEGVTGIDFPIHDFIVALLMKLSGSESPMIFRLYTLIYCLIGYIFLFQLVLELTHSKIKGFLIVVFVFTCPIIAYYQAGFIPSATSLSTTFMSYYFYFRFLRKGGRINMIVSVLLMTLAALARTPFNIFLFALLVQSIGNSIIVRKLEKYQLLTFAAAYTILIGYNIYKFYLNELYGTQFLTYLLPAESINEFFRIIAIAFQNWHTQIFTYYHYLIFGISILFIFAWLILNRKLSFIQKQVLTHGMLIIAGACAYFIAMTRQFVDHDYYFIDSFYPGIILLLILGISLIRFRRKLNSVFWPVILIVVLLGATIASHGVHESKHSEPYWDRFEVTHKNFKGSAVFLDELGIPRDAKMLVLGSYSTNVPLILMDRKGYTVLSTTGENIRKSFLLDFDFIVMQDVFLPSDIVFNYPGITQMVERIGGNGRISVFRFKRQTSNDLSDILGITDPIRIDRISFNDSVQIPEWKQVTGNAVAQSHSPPRSFFFDESIEFGPSFEYVVNAEKISKMLFEVYFLPTGENMIKIVGSALQNDSVVYYWEFPLHLKPVKEGKWQKYQCLFAVPEHLNSQIRLNCYLWNQHFQNVYLDDLKLTLY